MARLFIYFLCGLMLFSCKKSSDVTSTPGSGGGTGGGGTGGGIDTIALHQEVGDILIYKGDTLKTINAATGTVLSSIKISYIGFLAPAVIDENVLYTTTKAQLVATNLSTGAELFRKSYVGFYCNRCQTEISYPAIKDSIVYITCQGDGDDKIYLFAYHKKTGAKLFQAGISFGAGDQSPLLATPLISGNNVYVIYSSNGSSYTTSVFSFNRINGSLRWAKTLVGSSKGNPFLNIRNNELLVSDSKPFGAYESKIYSLDTASGNLNWQNTYSSKEFRLNEKILRNNQLLSVSAGVDEYHNTLNYINPANGQVTSTFEFGWYQYNINGDALYYTDNKNLYSYSLDNHVINWTKEHVAETYRKNLSNPSSYSSYATTPVVTDKYIYVLETCQTKTASLVIYNKLTGAVYHELPNFAYFDLTKIIIKDKNNNYYYPHRKYFLEY